VAISYAEGGPPDPIRLPLYETTKKSSQVTGEPLLTYARGKVREIEVPWYHRSVATGKLPRPRGYLVLPGWPQIEARLRGHGLRVERLASPTELEDTAMAVGGGPTVAAIRRASTRFPDRSSSTVEGGQGRPMVDGRGDREEEP
jgi:hypothetical protein